LIETNQLENHFGFAPYLWEGKQMADRKQFMEIKEADAELLRLLKDSENVSVTDEQLREQRISFAFGNALNLDSITKESVRHTSQHVRLLA
jgi:hypothetical protein